MTALTLKIDGMSCQHCVMSVKKALEGAEGVLSSEVSVGSAKISFDELKTSQGEIENAIKNAGYTIL